MAVILLLSIEGYMWGAFLSALRNSGTLRASLALPLGCFAHALFLLIFTVLRIPLSSTPLLILHILVVIFLCALFAFRGMLISNRIASPFEHLPLWSRILCIPLLCITLYGGIHAIVLPTFHYDSLANWVVRAKWTYIDEQLAMDSTPERGIRKNSYPILLHSTQLAANLGQRAWHDRYANTLSFLVCMSMVWHLFVLMRIHLRTTHALLCIALLFSIPLLSVHLAQGYADLPFMLFGLGAYLTLLLSRKRDPTYIFLSALLVAQSVWVKTEGIPYVLLPWMGMVLLHGMTKELHWKQVCASVLLTLLFSLPWILFALLSGVGLTPHGGSDMKFAFHADAVRVAFESLFIHGSFGVWWYIIPVLIFLSFKKAGLFTYLWPFFTIVFTFFVYLCTPNMEYLLNGQSFDRQMFLPLALLLFASLWHLLPHCMENTEI